MAEQPAPPPPGWAPPHAPPPAHPPVPGPQRDRLALLIPSLLAAIGLAAALIAWRTTIAAGAADAATEAGVGAARQRAASVIVGEGFTARSTEAYVDYERARRRAELLAAGERTAEAQLARMEAVSHWFLVRPEYLDPSGAYLPDRQRAAILAAEEARVDIQPEHHFGIADVEHQRMRLLLVAGVIIALALPLLTLAELARGRLKGGALVGGSAVFLIGGVLAAIAWV